MKLYYEETGSGTPILFCHEFAGDHRNWEPQMRYFSRRHRCITYSARGYKPSDVPKDWKDYSYKHWASDAVAVLDHLKIDKAHFVGLSMGGYTALQIGARPSRPRAVADVRPARARAPSAATSRTSARPRERLAEEFLKKGSAEVVEGLRHEPGAHFVRGQGSARLRGIQRGCSPSTTRMGSRNTMRGFQAERPSIYDFEAEIRKIKVPTLIVVGDEDEPCLEPSFLSSNGLPTSGLVVFPKTGHVVNQEEPALFNEAVADFIARVEAGRWPAARSAVVSGSSCASGFWSSSCAGIVSEGRVALLAYDPRIHPFGRKAGWPGQARP